LKLSFFRIKLLLTLFLLQLSQLAIGIGNTLFSTYAGIDPPAFNVVSSHFTDIPPSNSFTAAADDFTIIGFDWKINTVKVKGNYSDTLSPPAGTADSFNVYILANNAGLPNSTDLATSAIYAAENLSYTDLGGGELNIDFPNGPRLSAGTYWLVVQANIKLLINGQWNWQESSLTPNSGTTNGLESVWFQTAPLVSSPITSTVNCIGVWGTRVTTCGMSRNPDSNPPADRDLAFQLEGGVLIPGISTSKSNITTSEANTSDSLTVVLDSQPTSPVTVSVTSSDTSEGSVSTASLNFTTINWAIAQPITVSGVDDNLHDGNIAYTINFSASGGDYTGKTALVNASNTDNEIDSDGIPKSIEDSVPDADGTGTGDGNNDGTQDSTQSHVASLKSNAGSDYFTLANTEALNLSNVSVQAAPTTNMPEGVNFPFGLLSFTVNGVVANATVTMDIFVPYNAAVNSFYKKGNDGRWYDIATSISHIGTIKTKITIALVEGGNFDTDAINTTLTDPGGPAVTAKSIPVLSEWVLMILSILLAIFALMNIHYIQVKE
jgi:IPTL-CTERM motif